MLKTCLRHDPYPRTIQTIKHPAATKPQAALCNCAGGSFAMSATIRRAVSGASAHSRPSNTKTNAMPTPKSFIPDLSSPANQSSVPYRCGAVLPEGSWK